MSSYESTGTIRLKIDKKEKKGCVLFVPDEDHCVNHQGKKCAVFLPEGSCKDAPEGSCKDAKVEPFKKCLNSVELTLDICNCKMNTTFTALLNAAMGRSKVDVKVECNREELKLIGITVPALSDK